MRPADENSEEILIERLKNQEERALEELVEIYEAEVFRVVRQISKHLLPEEDVQEIANDTFYQLWRHAANLDIRKGSLGAYLVTSARNLTKNRLRTYKGSVFQVQDYDVVEMPDLFEKAEQEERQRFVQEALNRLSKEEKEIFIRYYYFYQTTEEIGDGRLSALLRSPPQPRASRCSGEASHMLTRTPDSCRNIWGLVRMTGHPL